MNDWRERVRSLALAAPSWMRERASDQLHIGGFTQVQLETPVLEVSDVPDPDEASRAMTFFVVTAVASGATVARVQCGRGPEAARLASAARETLGPALDRVDDENVFLMRYFDVYLNASAADGEELVRRLSHALEDHDDREGR